MVNKKEYLRFFCISFCIYLFFQLCFSNIGFCNDNKVVTPKLNKCVTCHGISGNSIVGMWPKLAEQHSDYMLKQLVEFKKGKDGNRFDPTMFGMLQGVSENELLELVEHYTNQNLEKSKLKIDAKVLELGKKLYLFGDSEKNIVACVGCHGIDGMGNKLAKYPVIKWQHAEYAMIQLKKFKSLDRSNDVNSIMRDIVQDMTDTQMQALTSYISVME